MNSFFGNFRKKADIVENYVCKLNKLNETR